MATLKPKQRKLASIGNYQLMALRIGEGSFSKVEVANHSILNTKVNHSVLKYLNLIIKSTGRSENYQSPRYRRSLRHQESGERGQGHVQT